MKFLNKLIPGFLDKLDHRLLVNKPVIWRTKAHYLLFYASIITATVFIFGWFYPHSIQQEIYKDIGDRESIAIFITCVISMVVIIFWVTRLYQFKTKISKWKHFFYTFCIYFICLFILFSSVSSFHYGSFMNRINLLSDYKTTYGELLDNNYHIPTYFPHYKEDILKDIDGYSATGQRIANDIFRQKNELNDFDYDFKGSKQYAIKSIEYLERQNLIQEYLIDLEKRTTNVKTRVPEVYMEQQKSTLQEQQLSPENPVFYREEFAKRALNFELGDQMYILKPLKEGEKGYKLKVEDAKNSFSKAALNKMIRQKNKKGKPNMDTAFWYENNSIASAMLFRYEHYIRLKNFLNELEAEEYGRYVEYLEKLDSLEQNQYFMDEHPIQYHEATALISYGKKQDSLKLFDRNSLKSKKFTWESRFGDRPYYEVDYSDVEEEKDKNRIELLGSFLDRLSPYQQSMYKKYIHFDRILYNDIQEAKQHNVFNSETGLEDFVFAKCGTYLDYANDGLDRIDSILFFNYFNRGGFSIKLAVDYYPRIIQKRYFDNFYEKDFKNKDELKQLLVKNNLVASAKYPDAAFIEPDLVYKRQLMSHAFEHIGHVRSASPALERFFTFMLANGFFSFCFAILIFYLSSVARNTILFSLLLMSLVYTILLLIGSFSPSLVGIFAMFFYIVFSLGLFIVFYKPKYQIKRIKLIITSYIFYAITVQFFMLYNPDFIIDIGIPAEWMAVSILIFTFCVLFFFSYYFIRYIQLPVKD